MVESIPWNEALLCLWTLVVGVVCFLAGCRRSSAVPQVGHYDYTAKVSRAGKEAIQKAAQQEYDDPWSAALQGRGEKENTV